ncbi:MAG: PKD domain-containing protein [Sphingobacteriales bacterium]|nr:MAG: PKD domain-containing protein [Sphingobacteriales bacterium]
MNTHGYLKHIPLKWLFALIFLFTSIKSSSQNCNTWLSVPSQPSFVRVGDLDITGDKITIEAIFNRTAPWNGLDVFQGDLVSKHEDPRDCNYLLRPSSAEITTTNGYYKTPTICPIQLNKTYHAAFVYDGTALKFYRNGYLMSQIVASGNLIQNDWQTQIGLYFNQLTQENFIGYINEVRIWKIARTQEQIKQYMAQSLPAPSTQNGLLAYYVFDNLLNKQGNPMWNGSLGGTATINKTNPNCTFVADSCSILPCSIQPPDFSFEQDVCNPKNITFQTNAPNIKNYQWNLGNGQLSNSRTVSISYADYGTYPVTLTVEDNNGCKANLTKNILIGLEPGDLIQNNDTSICEGVSILIQPKDTGVRYCWQPASGTSSFWVKPSKDTILTLTAKTIGANLVVNGNFSSGNIDFSSEYTFSGSGIPPGVFTVGDNPTAWHAGMVACGDKTTGVGNMMLVNGAQQPNVAVWTQTITVTPHTNYAFSTWVQTITTVNPAKLQFSINGKLIGNLFTADAQSCVWKQFSASWNSGAATTATIAIENMNQDFSGNDFALDDIFFGTVRIKQEAIEIKVAKSPIIGLGPDKEVCAGSSVQLNSNLEHGNSIQWTPSLYLDDTQAENPVSSPLQSVTYVAEAFNAAGCSRKD